jgi:hypothetical protein
MLLLATTNMIQGDAAIQSGRAVTRPDERVLFWLSTASLVLFGAWLLGWAILRGRGRRRDD